MPLDVNDYEKIAAMIARVETKIDALRKEVVTTDVQSVVNKSIADDISGIKERLTHLENAPGAWLLRLGVIASLALTLLTLLTHVKLLP